MQLSQHFFHGFAMLLTKMTPNRSVFQGILRAFDWRAAGEATNIRVGQVDDIFNCINGIRTDTDFPRSINVAWAEIDVGHGESPDYFGLVPIGRLMKAERADPWGRKA
jgi:hypothetical protein